MMQLDPENWGYKIFIFAINLGIAILAVLIPMLLGSGGDVAISILLAILLIVMLFIFLVIFTDVKKYYICLKSIPSDTEGKIKGITEYNHTQIFGLATKTKNYIDDTKHKHITLTNLSKEIIISNETLTTGLCQMHHLFKIHNHHEKDTYKSYMFQSESSEGLSDCNGYEFWLDDKGPITIPESAFSPYTQSSTDTNGNPVDLSGCKVHIPVDIKGKQTGTLEIIEKHTPSFSKLKNCSELNFVVESIAITVYYPTEVLKTTVCLDQSITGYKLDHAGKYLSDVGCSSGTNGFKVIDKSEQRIEPYEHKLNEWGAMPEYSKDGRLLTWEVHDPKVGYQYHLSFAMVKITPPPKVHTQNKKRNRR